VHSNQTFLYIHFAAIPFFCEYNEIEIV